MELAWLIGILLIFIIPAYIAVSLFSKFIGMFLGKTIAGLVKFLGVSAIFIGLVGFLFIA